MQLQLAKDYVPHGSTCFWWWIGEMEKKNGDLSQCSTTLQIDISQASDSTPEINHWTEPRKNVWFSVFCMSFPLWIWPSSGGRRPHALGLFFRPRQSKHSVAIWAAARSSWHPNFHSTALVFTPQSQVKEVMRNPMMSWSLVITLQPLDPPTHSNVPCSNSSNCSCHIAHPAVFAGNKHRFSNSWSSWPQHPHYHQLGPIMRQWFCHGIHPSWPPKILRKWPISNVGKHPRRISRINWGILGTWVKGKKLRFCLKTGYPSVSSVSSSFSY